MNKIFRKKTARMFAVAIIFIPIFILFFKPKILGIRAIILEFSFVLFIFGFVSLPFVYAILNKEIGIRILSLLWGIILLYMMVFVFHAPQESVMRIYNQVKNHVMLDVLDADDILYIDIDAQRYEDTERIFPIVQVLTESKWYSPNHEPIGEAVLMSIVYKDGGEINFYLSRFLNEDNAKLLFIRAHEDGSAGYWADGNAYVPRLPSVLENLGYTLSNNQ